MQNEGETIAALATAPVPAGIAVVRISGPKTRTALKSLFHSRRRPISHKRELVFGEVIDYTSGEVIDRALAVFMPAPRSFTGEDVAEFHVHGSPMLVQKILRSIYAFGINPAEPGEFTKRAFLNGKIDLVQAESVADLINATSDRALIVAGDHLEGKFSEAVNNLGEPLRNIVAELEASIDFPEEGIEPRELTKISQTLLSVRDKVNALLATYRYGQLVKEGFKVLLCGLPNVGKSSLLNRLLNTERAIVTDISGTTRDLIEEEAIISGYKFVFCDSAGISDSTDKVERIGIELAKSKIAWADLVLLVVDATDAEMEWQEVLKLLHGQAKKIWMVTNKIDLNSKAIGTFFCDSQYCAQNFYISAKRGDGFEALLNALVDEVQTGLPDRAESSGVVTNERHINCLSRAEVALERGHKACIDKLPAELVSSEVRLALIALEELVGKTYNEDILGRIFSKFCIGK